MAKFYERYGHVIFNFLMALAFGVGSFWLLAYLAKQGILPSPMNQIVKEMVRHVDLVIGQTTSLAAEHKELIGAILTLAPVIFAIWRWVQFSRKYFPRRLARFIEDEMPSVYAVGENIIRAVDTSPGRQRSGFAAGTVSALLFKGPLDAALDSLGQSWRPRKQTSLEETIEDLEQRLAVVRECLRGLEETRCHALLLRGTVIASTHNSKPRSNVDKQEISREVDKHFSDVEQSARRVSKAELDPEVLLSALELRGVLRARRGDTKHALADFGALEHEARIANNRLKLLRALRMQAELRMEQYEHSGTWLRLTEAQRNLGDAWGILEAANDLKHEELIEAGHNRFCYGQLSERRKHPDGNLNTAINAYIISVERYKRSGIQDVQQFINSATMAIERCQKLNIPQDAGNSSSSKREGRSQ